VLALGITHAQERETHDRAHTSLPGLQLEFALNVTAAAAASHVPVVIVLCNGGMVSVDELLPRVPAIVEAFNPVDHGTAALAASLFGAANRWGKLPITIYDQNYTALLDAAGAGIGDYELAKPPGRSYRYYNATPLYHFGHGLSFTSFSHSCTRDAAHGPAAARAPEQPYRFVCELANTGSRAGDEVLQVYHSLGDAARAVASKLHPVPRSALIAFERVHLGVGAKTQIAVEIDVARLAVTRADGSKHVYPGEHSLLFSRDGVSGVTLNVTVHADGE